MAKGKKTGGGSRKGRPNKATIEFKEALNALMNTAAPDLIKWLEEIDDPFKRFEVLSKFAEFIHPKLARQEIVGDEESPLAYKDVTDVKSKILKALPEDELNRILADNNDS